MAKSRRKFTPQEKVAILRRHLLEHVPVSDLCDEHQLNPNVFYRWQKKPYGRLASKAESSCMASHTWQFPRLQSGRFRQHRGRQVYARSSSFVSPCLFGQRAPMPVPSETPPVPATRPRLLAK